MKTDLISVLVPIYNAGDWLRNCLESIASQSYESLEAILVDDGSTDGSRELCEQFCGRDGRFRLIRQENSGVSVARNAALDAAQGQYVFFLDADDYLAPQALQILYDALRSGPYDMATAEYRNIGCTEDAVAPETSTSIRILTGADCIHGCFFCSDMRWRVVWNHLIPRSLIGDLRFEPVFQEDALFCYCLFLRMGQSIVVNEPTYYYANHPESLSKTPGYLSEEAFLAISLSMLDKTPAEQTTYRGWMLKKLYRHYLLNRFHKRKEGDSSELMTLYRQLVQKTQREYFSHPDISFGEKCMFGFLDACPWAMWILMKVTRNG